MAANTRLSFIMNVCRAGTVIGVSDGATRVSLTATTPSLSSLPKALRPGQPRVPATIVYGIDSGGSRAKKSS